MAAEYNDVKICVRSLLISSQKPLSILEIQNDYYEQEGIRIPYKSLGFNSVIELLQNMTDVLIVPPNPNPNSVVSLVGGGKTNHLRLLVSKQKSNSKKQKKNPNLNRSYKNNSFGGYKSNKNMSNSSNHFGNYAYKSSQFQNTESHYCRSSSSLSQNSSQGSRAPLSNIGISSGLKSNYSVQNGSHRPGYVTYKLQSDIERYISENKMIIPLDKLKELVKNHSDFSFMQASCMSDVINLVQDFLSINEKGVSLKHINAMKNKKNIPLIYLKTDKIQNSSNSFNTDQPINLLLSSLIVNNSSNNNNKSIDVTKSFHYECNDKVAWSNNTHKVQDSFENKLKNVSHNVEVTNNMDKHSKYIEECVKLKMLKKLQDGNSIYNKNKNYNYDSENFKKNIEFVKRQTEMRQSKKFETKNLNVSGSSDYLSSTNYLDNSETLFSHSTPNKNKNSDIENAEILLNKNQSIPREVLYNIARIFKTYDRGVNIENFKLIYSKMYYTIFDSTSYGFSSTTQMFKVLDKLIDVRDNVLYTKHKLAYCTMYKNIYHTNDNNKSIQNQIIPKILSNNNQKIVLNVDQQLFNSEDVTSMLLVEAYNPSLFFLQLAYKDVELDRLTKQMHDFYSVERESNNYVVRPEYIVPGLIYASSYTSFTTLKQWHRVRILREVDSKTVHIIHVDYGTMDIIPKTELRFLKDVFGYLRCQAIHCCLTGYNELDTISPEVTEAFLNCIGSAQVSVQVDNNFKLNEQCQILHVTLIKKKSKIFININDEITIRYLKCL